MSPSGDASGQHWRLVGQEDGKFALRTNYLGECFSLDVINDGTNTTPFLGPTEGVSGQYWTLTPLADGTFRLTNDQSYGQLTLDVTMRSDLRWRRLHEKSIKYDFGNFNSQKSFIHDAASLFRQAEVTFSDYQMVFVVTPKMATHFANSPAFNARAGDGPVVQGHEIRLGVTFGQDSRTNRYINLVHEVGHLFGLPDLYPTDGGGAYNSKIGCWSIMSDIFHSVSFLGWHRHKNGWLPASRATYIRTLTSPWYGTISPLSGSCGLSMVVLPIDDPDHPSKVFAIELAQPVLGTNQEYWGDGVLVYTVDATIESGKSPVVLMPRRVSDSPDYGYLYEAPYGVGDVAQAPGSASGLLTVTVMQKFGSSFNIKIEYQRP